MQAKNVNIKNYSNKLIVFILIESCLYCYFLYLDFYQIAPITSSYVKFLSISLCAFFLFFISESSSRFPYLRLTKITLILTFFADIFLLFTDYYTPGIWLFIIIQGCYRIRLRSDQMLKQYYRAAIYYFLPCLFLLLFTNISFNLSFLSALFYFICLLLNVFTCLKLLRNSQTHILKKTFCIGVIFLFFCDIQVGISNISSYINTGLNNAFLPFLLNFASIGMWFFYLPSQIIITVCGILAPYK